MIVDDATWFALAVVLTVLGLAATVALWRLRGPASGVRGLAWSVLPGAAYLTGTLRLVGRIVDAVGSWAVHLVLSPTVWVGIVLAGVSAALFTVAAGMRRHGAGRRTSRKAALPDTSSRRPAKAAKPAGPADDDMDDIEAILKKHGI